MQNHKPNPFFNSDKNLDAILEDWYKDSLYQGNGIKPPQPDEFEDDFSDINHEIKKHVDNEYIYG